MGLRSCRLNYARGASVTPPVNKRNHVEDFISIDEFLTDMVRCGVVSEDRYSELMNDLDAAFERSRSETLDGSGQVDVFEPIARLKPH